MKCHERCAARIKKKKCIFPRAIVNVTSFYASFNKMKTLSTCLYLILPISSLFPDQMFLQIVTGYLPESFAHLKISNVLQIYNWSLFCNQSDISLCFFKYELRSCLFKSLMTLSSYKY